MRRKALARGVGFIADKADDMLREPRRLAVDMRSKSPGGIMVHYDPGIIKRYAELMYRRARSVVIIWTLVLVVPGLIGGVLLAEQLRIPRENNVVVIGLTTLVAAVIGFLIGQSRAFWLRLQAQVLLCQARIEQNTR